MINENIKELIKFQHRIGSLTRDTVEKSIQRNSRKDVKQSRSAMLKLLKECGGGNTPMRYSNNTIDDIISLNNDEFYPKEVSQCKYTVWV